ncbi:MAG: hypothetical protein AAF329_21065, partial [Cyanobacteria bacterium P01_A01_bin.17]
MGLSEDFIGSAVKAGVKAGVSSATGGILSAAGKALLDSIIPGLFGGSSGPSEDTLLILDALDD